MIQKLVHAQIIACIYLPQLILLLWVIIVQVQVIRISRDYLHNGEHGYALHRQPILVTPHLQVYLNPC